jgi:hypothetical protein
MGFDLGSIHAAGSPSVRALRTDLRKQSRGCRREDGGGGGQARL